MSGMSLALRDARRASDISLKALPEGDTTTITEDVPVIMPQSGLVLEVYDSLHELEQVACQVLSGSSGSE